MRFTGITVRVTGDGAHTTHVAVEHLAGDVSRDEPIEVRTLNGAMPAAYDCKYADGYVRYTTGGRSGARAVRTPRASWPTRTAVRGRRSSRLSRRRGVSRRGTSGGTSRSRRTALSIRGRVFNADGVCVACSARCAFWHAVAEGVRVPAGLVVVLVVAETWIASWLARDDAARFRAPSPFAHLHVPRRHPPFRRRASPSSPTPRAATPSVTVDSHSARGVPFLVRNSEQAVIDAVFPSIAERSPNHPQTTDMSFTLQHRVVARTHASEGAARAGRELPLETSSHTTRACTRCCRVGLAKPSACVEIDFVVKETCFQSQSFLFSILRR